MSDPFAALDQVVAFQKAQRSSKPKPPPKTQRQQAITRNMMLPATSIHSNPKPNKHNKRQINNPSRKTVKKETFRSNPVRDKKFLQKRDWSSRNKNRERSKSMTALKEDNATNKGQRIRGKEKGLGFGKKSYMAVDNSKYLEYKMEDTGNLQGKKGRKTDTRKKKILQKLNKNKNRLQDKERRDNQVILERLRNQKRKQDLNGVGKISEECEEVRPRLNDGEGMSREGCYKPRQRRKR